MILALDLGTETGFALGENGNIVESGVVELKESVWDGGGARCWKLRRWLAATVLSRNIEAVFYEKVEFNATTASGQMAGALMGAMAAVLEELQIPYMGVGTGAWKKTFCGNGAATKQQVVDVAVKMGRKVAIVKKGGVEQSDEADAIGILMHGFKERRCA